jgi:hypothetical protein
MRTVLGKGLKESSILNPPNFERILLHIKGSLVPLLFPIILNAISFYQ